VTYVTTAEQRAGILIAVVSGGRPELRHRPTAQLLAPLADAGFAGVLWSVREDEADGYERDAYELLPYSAAWAREYAEAHWTAPDVPVANGWYGGIAGREAACREAERRGCWGILLLDDNINWLCFLRGDNWSKRFVTERGGMALFADLLAAVCLSTNAWLVGAQLDAVNPLVREASTVARAGFPYSLYIERVGPGREEYFGPWEEDIIHDLQYGTRVDGATAAVVPLLHYKKETSSTKGGNREHYRPDGPRAKSLQRMFPQAAKVIVKATTSNGRGQPRVFHQMPPGAMRNRLIIRDSALFGAVRTELETMAGQWYEGEVAANREKVLRRVAQAGRMRPSGNAPSSPVPLSTDAPA
jgi:hypothetical protein